MHISNYQVFNQNSNITDKNIDIPHHTMQQYPRYTFLPTGHSKTRRKGSNSNLSYANICLTHFSKRNNKLWIGQTK